MAADRNRLKALGGKRTSPPTRPFGIWEEFENRTIDPGDIGTTEKNMVSMRTDTEKQHQEAAAAVRELKSRGKADKR